MFTYGADFFAFKPGLVMLALGLFLTVPLSLGAVTVGPLTFSLYWMLLGVSLSFVGLQSFYAACLAQVLCDYSGAARRRWARAFPYTRTILGSAGLFATGLVAVAPLVLRYVSHGFALPSAELWYDHLAVTGMLLMMVGFSTFIFVLLLQATGVRFGRVDG
jgi:hypothetical protein